MGDHDKVVLTPEDAEFILRQLNMAMSRTNSGQRLGAHLIKRIRKSKAILLTRLEEWEERAAPSEVVQPEPVQTPVKAFLKRLLG